MSVGNTGEQPQEPYAAFVAIDWADQQHVWALQGAKSAQRQQGEIEATPEAVEAWVGELQTRFSGSRIAVALEQKRGALLCQLSKYESLVLYPVHPATVSRMRAALYPSTSKDDPKDADLLLDILTLHRGHLRRLDPDTVETRKLQILVEERRKLVDEQTGYSNQLRAKLKLYYPQAVRWLGELTSVLAGDFVDRWPTLPELQRARPKTLRDFFYQHNCRDKEWIEQRLEEIPQAVVATEDAAVVEGSVAMVKALVAVLRVLRTHIAEFDRQIAATLAVHSDLAIVRSLPGAGEVMEPRLIAAMGTQRDRYPSAGELAAMSGIAPVQQRSGQSCFIHFRWACPKFVRQTFHEWAGHTIAHSKWAKAYYDEQIRKNKGHHAAVRALAFKWLRILFRCWKDGQRYDESRYIEALRRRGSPLAQALS
jgi:transposase